MKPSGNSYDRKLIPLNIIRWVRLVAQMHSCVLQASITCRYSARSCRVGWPLFLPQQCLLVCSNTSMARARSNTLHNFQSSFSWFNRRFLCFCNYKNSASSVRFCLSNSEISKRQFSKPFRYNHKRVHYRIKLEGSHNFISTIFRLLAAFWKQ